MDKQSGRQIFSGRGHAAILLLMIFVLSSLACNVPINQQPAAVVDATQVVKAALTPSSPESAAESSNSASIPDAVTATPSLPVESLTEDALDPPKPEDVLQQVGIFGSGAGADCKGNHNAPWFAIAPDDRELMEATIMLTCGWKNGERVKITVTDPLGKEEVFQETAKAEGNTSTAPLFFSYPALINRTAGKYTFHFQGSKTSLEGAANFAKRVTPTIYTVDAEQMRAITGSAVAQKYLMVVNFAPNEAIRLLVFRQTTEESTSLEVTFLLIGTRSYHADADGRLFISPDLHPQPYQQYSFVASGEQTGEAHLLWEIGEGRLVDVMGPNNMTCPGAQPTHLTGVKTVRAAKVDGSKLRVRKEPGFSAGVLASVAEGTKMHKVDGPRCVDGAFWYKVELSNKKIGWVAEVYEGKYILEPVK